MAEILVNAWDEAQFEHWADGADAGVSVVARSQPLELYLTDMARPGSDGTVKRNCGLSRDAVIRGHRFPAGSAVAGRAVGIRAGQPNGRLVLASVTSPDTGLQAELLFSETEFAREQAPMAVHWRDWHANAVPECAFARGTLIATPHGDVPVEHLDAGDELMTPGGGCQLAHGVTRVRFSAIELLLDRDLRPVCIGAGTLPGGLPGHDLTVAQKHRVLVEDWRAALLFGEDTILVAARALVNGRDITTDCPNAGIEYCLIGGDRNGLVCANGLWAEGTTPAQNREHLGKTTPAAGDHGLVSKGYGASPIPKNGTGNRRAA